MNKTTAEEILWVLCDYPTLTRNGFDSSSSIFCTGLMAADFYEQVDRAREWLNTQQPIKTPGSGSYGIKHVAERWHRRVHPNDNPFICNGAMIVACALKGFPIKRRPGRINALLGLRRRLVEQSEAPPKWRCRK